MPLAWPAPRAATALFCPDVWTQTAKLNYCSPPPSPGRTPFVQQCNDSFRTFLDWSEITSTLYLQIKVIAKHDVNQILCPSDLLSDWGTLLILIYQKMEDSHNWNIY